MSLQLIAIAVVQAADTNNAISDTGKQIATQGANGVAACASCHGRQGEGNAASGFPRLVKQSPQYLSRQMVSFANGSRNNPVMTPIAKSLTPSQIDALAAYYATLVAPASSKATSSKASAKLTQRGRTLTSIGDNAKQIQSCANCHGPGGIGEYPDYPYLAGQVASYLNTALSEWKSGNRKTDTSQQMNTIAQRLDADDITAVVAYYASQPAPIGNKRQNVIPSAPKKTPPSSTHVPASPQRTEGTGTEQGAPTAGGNQGPGGGGGTRNPQ